MRIAPWISIVCVFLFIGTALATVDQDLTNLLFDWQLLSGRFYVLFEFVLDLFGIVKTANTLYGYFGNATQYCPVTPLVFLVIRRNFSWQSSMLKANHFSNNFLT